MKKHFFLPDQNHVKKNKRCIENNLDRNGSSVGQHTVSINNTEK